MLQSDVKISESVKKGKNCSKRRTIEIRSRGLFVEFDDGLERMPFHLVNREKVSRGRGTFSF